MNRAAVLSFLGKAAIVLIWLAVCAGLVLLAVLCR